MQAIVRGCEQQVSRLFVSLQHGVVLRRLVWEGHAHARLYRSIDGRGGRARARRSLRGCESPLRRDRSARSAAVRPSQARPDCRYQENPRHLGHQRARWRLRDRCRNPRCRDRRMRGSPAGLARGGRGRQPDRLDSDSGPGIACRQSLQCIVTGAGRTSLGRDELIVEFHLPKRPPRSADAYLRFIPRTEMDIAVVGAAVSVTLDPAGVCTGARVVLGAVAPTALLVADAAAALIGRALDATALDALDQAARRACKPIDDKRGTIEYRIKVAGVMARRAATIAYERARSR